MRLHMGRRTDWWMEGCEDEWEYGWMERMDGDKWVDGCVGGWVIEWVVNE